MGLDVETARKTGAPFPVSVNAGAIGGPSAGLAFTLAILDALSNGKLTGGHKSPPQARSTRRPTSARLAVSRRHVAVEKAGAQVFFVPKAE